MLTSSTIKTKKVLQYFKGIYNKCDATTEPFLCIYIYTSNFDFDYVGANNYVSFGENCYKLIGHILSGKTEWTTKLSSYSRKHRRRVTINSLTEFEKQDIMFFTFITSIIRIATTLAVKATIVNLSLFHKCIETLITVLENEPQLCRTIFIACSSVCDAIRDLVRLYDSTHKALHKNLIQEFDIICSRMSSSILLL